MSVLSGRLVRFQAIEDGQVYFADVKEDETPRKGNKIQAYESLVSLKVAGVARKLTVAKVKLIHLWAVPGLTWCSYWPQCQQTTSQYIVLVSITGTTQKKLE